MNVLKSQWRDRCAPLHSNSKKEDPMRKIAQIVTMSIPVVAAAVFAVAGAPEAAGATGGLENAANVIMTGTTQDIVNMTEGLVSPATFTVGGKVLTITGPAGSRTLGADFLNQSHYESSHLVVAEVVVAAESANGRSEHDAFLRAGQVLWALDRNQAGPLASDWAAIQGHFASEDMQAMKDGFNS